MFLWGFFSTFLAVFVPFFSYIWRCNHNFTILTTSIERSQKITSIWAKNSHPKFFFTRNKIKKLAKTCDFFGITKPLCSANWEPAVHLFTYLNYQIGFSMLYTSKCEWIRKVKYNQHGLILPRLTYYSSPALWKAFWSFWKRRMKSHRPSFVFEIRSNVDTPADIVFKSSWGLLKASDVFFAAIIVQYGVFPSSPDF